MAEPSASQGNFNHLVTDLDAARAAVSNAISGFTSTPATGALTSYGGALVGAVVGAVATRAGLGPSTSAVVGATGVAVGIQAVGLMQANIPAAFNLAIANTQLSIATSALTTQATQSAWSSLLDAIVDFFGDLKDSITGALSSAPAVEVPAAPAGLLAEPAINNDWGGVGYDDPLILNLIGAHVHTTDLHGSTTKFDVMGNGTKVSTAWTTAGEGFLVLPALDGTVHNANNIIPTFTALAQFDLNHDGVIDAKDTVYSQLRVWQNVAGDGIFRSADMFSLSNLGIASISLGASYVPRYDNGNIIMNESSFTYSDGRKGEIAQAVLMTGNSASGTTVVADATSITVRVGNGQATRYITGSGQTINLEADGTSLYVDLGSKNTINASALTNGIVVANNAATVNLGAASNLTVVAGGGAQINAGSGKNTIYIEGDGTKLTGGTGALTVTIDGDSANVYAAAANNVALVNGNKSVVTVGQNATLTVGGTSNTANAGDGSTVTVSGISAGVNVGNSAKVFVTGLNDALNVGTQSNVTISGAGDYVNIGAKSTVAVSGLYDTVNVGAYSSVAVAGSYDTITVGLGSAVAVAGANDTINVGIYSAVAAGGTNNVFNIGADHSIVSVTSPSAVIHYI